ncbi:MAG: hypothetical protein WDZ35_01710 [Crocinitomicaceae bacterium]
MSEEILDEGVIAPAKETVNITKDKAIYAFKNTSEDQLAEKLQAFLLKDGYKLEAGTVKNGTYGKGSKTMRILFGAFVKRFTWGVKVQDKEGATYLVFSKDEKGYWGGAIGVSQVKKEYARITSVLKNFHAAHHDK